MKKTKSMKLISLLLSMMMVLSLFSVTGMTASAAEVTTAEEFSAAVRAGGEIKLANDITIQSVTLSFQNAATLDLNGHSIVAEDDYCIFSLRAPLTIKDSVGGGKIVNPRSSYGFAINSHGSLTLEGGTLEFTNDYSSGIDADMGSFTMTGGAIVSSKFSIWRDGGNVTISGGTINGEFRDSDGSLSITGGRFSFDPTSLLTAPNTATKIGNYWVVNATVVDVDSILLDKNSISMNVGGVQRLEASVSPADATDRTVIWSTGGADKVKLYTDESCMTEVGTGATDKLVVYAKGTGAGSASIEVTSNAALQKYATCTVTVNPVHDTHNFTYSVNGATITRPTASP